MPMSALLSRRRFFSVTAAVAGACVESRRAAAQERAKLALEDFQPKSMLVADQHPVERAKFPIIDVHTHLSSVFGRRRAPKRMDLRRKRPSRSSRSFNGWTSSTCRRW